MIFDSFVFKENDSFYIDLSQTDMGISFELGDTIKFKHNQITYIGKIESKLGDDYFKIKVTKEIV